MAQAVPSAARAVGRLSNKLRRKLDAFSSRKEFSGSQGRTLHFLLAQTEDVFQKDVEEEFGIRPPTATELLKQMEKNGLILREPAEHDNRLKKIVLTEKALLFREQVRADLAGLEQTLTAGISPQDLAAFFRVMDTMMDNISE